MPTGVYKHKSPSEETKRKIRDGNRGKIVSIKTRRKLSEIGRGRKLSDEHRKNLSESHKGYKIPKEQKEKMSIAQRGERGSNWQGGKSFECYGIDWTETLRESIRQRDDYFCQLCGIHQDELIGRFKKLDVHHIDYNKKNLSPDNLVILCKKCHSKTNYNRKYWIEYFVG